MKYSEALRKYPEGFKATLTETAIETTFWEDSNYIANGWSRVLYKGRRVFVSYAAWQAATVDKLSPEEIAKQLEACGE